MKERFTIERFQLRVLSISNTGYVVCISNSFSFAPTAAAALLVAFWFCGNPRPPTRDDDKWMRRFFLYVFLLHFVLLFYSNVASAPASLVSDVWTTPPALRRLPIHLEMARFQLGDFLQKVLGPLFLFGSWFCLVKVLSNLQANNLINRAVISEGTPATVAIISAISVAGSGN